MHRTVLLHPELPAVHRLGLATRGNTRLEPRDVRRAIDAGVNYLNWCGYDDGIRRAVRELRAERERLVLAVQLRASTAKAAREEFEGYCRDLGTDRIDVVTFYYMESDQEWREIESSRGALEALQEFKRDGRIRSIGLTSHQRGLAASIAEQGAIDLLMIRYNAAHRGAERDVFPITDRVHLPVVAYTGVRWGALLRPLANQPVPDWLPTAPDCYRFQLSNPSVAVALVAPDGEQELTENLSLLDDWRPCTAEEISRLARWGDCVRENAGSFP